MKRSSKVRLDRLSRERIGRVTRLSIAIDNRLYWQGDVETVSLQVIVSLVNVIAGELWNRAEFYTVRVSGVITR